MAVAYSSAILFHGPGAQIVAHQRAEELGRLLHEPFGLEGLKIAESREIVELMGGTPLGDVPGVLIIGPMDHAWPASTDVLLKTLEEFDGRVLRPVLWAWDEGGVRGTIRSRCLRQWCPGPEVEDEVLLAQIRDLLDSSLVGDRVRVLEILKEGKGQEDLFLGAAAQLLRARTMGSRELVLWERVREALRFHNPSITEIKAVFL